jgi:hypothetical protein
VYRLGNWNKAAKAHKAVEPLKEKRMEYATSIGDTRHSYRTTVEHFP